MSLVCQIFGHKGSASKAKPTGVWEAFAGAAVSRSCILSTAMGERRSGSLNASSHLPSDVALRPSSDNVKPTLRWHTAACFFAFLLLALRLAYPAGYMPASSSRGFALVLCDGYSKVPQASAHGKAHHQSPEDPPGDINPPNPCSYAAAGSLSALTSAASFVPRAMPADVEQSRPLTSHDNVSRIAERPRSRAPPEAFHVAT